MSEVSVLEYALGKTTLNKNVCFVKTEHCTGLEQFCFAPREAEQSRVDPEVLNPSELHESKLRSNVAVNLHHLSRERFQKRLLYKAQLTRRVPSKHLDLKVLEHT